MYGIVGEETVFDGESKLLRIYIKSKRMRCETFTTTKKNEEDVSRWFSENGERKKLPGFCNVQRSKHQQNSTCIMLPYKEYNIKRIAICKII